jgi:hypothetical protein
MKYTIYIYAQDSDMALELVGDGQGYSSMEIAARDRVTWPSSYRLYKITVEELYR